MAASPTIDVSKLPLVVLIDTSVLIPALRGQVKPSEDPACPALLDALVNERRSVLIAAPSAAEIFRRAPTTSIPRTPLIRVFPFDLLAAEILGKQVPPHVINSFKDPAKPRPADYIKYDAMILACAVRHRADALISTDENRRPLAVSVGLPMQVPSDYARPPAPPSPQRELFGPTTGTTPTTTRPAK